MLLIIRTCYCTVPGTRYTDWCGVYGWHDLTGVAEAEAAARQRVLELLDRVEAGGGGAESGVGET